MTVENKNLEAVRRINDDCKEAECQSQGFSHFIGKLILYPGSHIHVAVKFSVSLHTRNNPNKDCFAFDHSSKAHITDYIRAKTRYEINEGIKVS